MQSNARHAVGRLVMGQVLCAVALAGTALAGPSTQSAEAATAHYPAPGKTTYRVVNLAPGEFLNAVINARGEVAYSLADPWPGPGPGIGPTSSWFYDGVRSINIGRQGVSGFLTIADLNNAGQVLGFGELSPGRSGVSIWTKRHGYTELGLLPTTDRILEAHINNHGVVAGSAAGGDNVNLAFRWSRTNGMEDLGALGNGAYRIAYARGINDAGAITGESWALESDYHGFLWTRATGMVDIHTNDSDDSSPVGISARGHVAGNYHYDGPDWRGYVWTPRDGMRDLNPGGVETSAWAMSASGQVTGSIGSFETGRRAMTWTRSGGLVDLGTLGGDTSGANRANNHGQVVGYAATAANGFRAFAWTARDGMVDLNTRLRRAPPGLRLENAVAISDNGSIVATSNAGLVLLKPERGGACGCPHTVGPIAASDMVALGAPLAVAVGVAGDSPAAPYRIDWDWGDGSTASSASLAAGGGERRSASLAAGGGERRSAAVHSYATPGIHTVRATVVDRAGNRVAVSRKVVAWAPGRGIAAGAGAFASRYAGGTQVTVHPGTARFSFVAPLAQGAAAGIKPALHFDVPGLNFVGADIGGVVLEGGVGRLEGSGAVNGKDGYRFRLAASASDARGDPGRVALKIWRVDPATRQAVTVYDNGEPAGRPGVQDVAARGGEAGSALAQGNIALH
ncbi:PKD domain-containing protein [Massilia sp. HP4]|uniref:PKD domain-containing protein n=1 Tax=Massilia sp. HP4 TaxID=2562316 RepID=UPI001484EFE5|nr:PKD domain-containing protein [Massilia sp. HP4]